MESIKGDIKELESADKKLWACILIGGKSSRMGMPKHLLVGLSGKTWLEEKVECLKSYVEGLVLAGGGNIPEGLESIERVGDAEKVAGPLAGILGAMRTFPERNWLVCACDMPLVEEKAVEWLLRQGEGSELAVIPMREAEKRGEIRMLPEPLFALYMASAKPLLEQLAREEELRMSRIVSLPGVTCPEIPMELQGAWTNINTQDQAQAFTKNVENTKTRI